MNDLILHTDVQDFIRKNLRANLFNLVLGESPFPGITTRELAEQIESMRKAEKKLPSWFSCPAPYFPNKRHLEQSSSELTAAYKAGIIPVGVVFDLSGGFGVDTYYFSRQAGRVVYCESDRELARIAAHNFAQLGATAISCHPVDGINWLEGTREKADLVYIDPSRRTAGNKRVFRFADCSPNVPRHLELLHRKSDALLIKASPLHDLQAGIDELGVVIEIHIVAVHNEVKEVLWLLKKRAETPVQVITINITPPENQRFQFSFPEEQALAPTISEPLAYLYEPNAAILKSGGFKSVAVRYGLNKLQEHSHLYTADRLLDFPGRRFRVVRTLPYSRKAMQEIKQTQANVSTRNFPEPVATIRKRYRIRDGGTAYIFFTTLANGQLRVIECEKI